MKRILPAGSYLLLALWLGGCSTLSGDFHQKLQIDALDAQNRPVDGMRCQVGSGASGKTVVTPATDVRVRRALASLEIECKRDNLVATATVKSRRERMEEALLPFGSAAVFIDHLSGSLYSYPTALHLRVGQHVVLEHGGEAQVVKSEPIPLEQQPGSASVSVPRSDLASVQPAAPGQRTDGAAAQPAAKAHRAASAAARPSAKAQRAASAAAQPVAKAPRTASVTAQPAANAATADTQSAAPTVPKPQVASASKSDRTSPQPAKTARAAAATPKA